MLQKVRSKFYIEQEPDRDLHFFRSRIRIRLFFKGRVRSKSPGQNRSKIAWIRNTDGCKFCTFVFDIKKIYLNEAITFNAGLLHVDSDGEDSVGPAGVGVHQGLSCLAFDTTLL
jgi:hypothetical protein